MQLIRELSWAAAERSEDEMQGGPLVKTLRRKLFQMEERIKSYHGDALSRAGN